MGGETLADRGTGPPARTSWPEPEPQVHLDARTLRPGVAVLSVAGEIDMLESDAIRSRLVELLRAPEAQLVVLDLSAVRFMGSHGLTAVVQAQRTAAGLGRTLRGVTGDGNRAVTRPVTIAGLDKLIDWFPGLAEATAGDAGAV